MKKFKKERVCRDCGIEFSKKFSKKGTINQCDECSEGIEDHRVMGYNDGSLNKSTSIAIYRGKNPEVIKRIKRPLQTVG